VIRGRVEGRVELTLADQYAGIYWAAPRAFRIGVIALALGTVFVIVFELASPQPNITIVGLLVLFAIACIGMVAVGHKRLKPGQKRIEYLIDSERIVIRDETDTAFVTPWSTVTAVEEHASGLVLKQRNGGRWLVKRAFTPEALATLKTFVPRPAPPHLNGKESGTA
jgi:hypothetical protein